MKRRRKRPTAEITRLNKTLPRLELATALEMTGGLDEGHLAKLLRSNGESSGKNISTLAAAIGLPYKRVVECYRDMKRLEGIAAVAQRLPKVMEDVAADAESKEVTCASCEGTGQIVIKRDDQGLPVETKRCLPCEGSGKQVKSGDPVARKQVLEMMELTGKAPIWAPNSQIVSLGDSLEDTLRAVRRGREAGGGASSDQRGPNADEQDSRTINAGHGTPAARTI
jgi:hypothetical protein